MACASHQLFLQRMALAYDRQRLWYSWRVVPVLQGQLPPANIVICALSVAVNGAVRVVCSMTDAASALPEKKAAPIHR